MQLTACLTRSSKNIGSRVNLFTFDELVRTLDKSSLLTIHPNVAEDFLDYSKLLDSLYPPLSGNIKTNHIFSCTDDGT